MDIRALQFPDHSFDVAIDKGTMDAMMTSSGSVWDPPQQVIDDCTQEVNEVARYVPPVPPSSPLLLSPYLTLYLQHRAHNLTLSSLGSSTTPSAHSSTSPSASLTSANGTSFETTRISR